ncbi:putative family 2C serine/threonine phosphatase [Cafeteria roenbergensis virus]|uniref:Putative family 2C serine/threonine phosphatase n=1 Tax=Cafeteria roenbergensis virus (strain BV-PW1) TaxID=693272 RepID=E3T5P6_CROVB|nr:putative family 2C serine/threonine phosphatase [Cafeteria roenbergensis virus BV-PW1]ADO67509.1 putative family 2C serine/threonine phosphatase [Cafeteria roenbergensis virus BV-PW1]
MVKIHQISLQGKRPTNEDEHIVFQNLHNFNRDFNQIDIIGVFDGHGGKLVSKFAKDNLPNYFSKKNAKLFNDSKYTAKYINKVFKNFNDNLEKQHPRAASYSGSTCCMAVITKDDKSHKKGNILWVINAGDSRIILGNRIGLGIPLSHDHKPNMPEERIRIEALDGGKDKIYYDGSDWRVADLSLSRALGDLEAHPYVTPMPQVYRYRIHPEDNFIVVACDGIWDVMDNQEVIDLLKSNIKKQNLAKVIADAALNKGSTDNVTVIVYQL